MSKKRGINDGMLPEEARTATVLENPLARGTQLKPSCSSSQKVSIVEIWVPQSDDLQLADDYHPALIADDTNHYEVMRTPTRAAGGRGGGGSTASNNRVVPTPDSSPRCCPTRGKTKRRLLYLSCCVGFCLAFLFALLWLVAFKEEKGSQEDSVTRAPPSALRVNSNGWSSWTNWSSCSTSCGAGVQQRYRECNAPTDETLCRGLPVENRQCHKEDCSSVDGAWSMWSDWSACGSTCGSGVQMRRRNCTDPVPEYGGRSCMGSDVDLKICTNKDCPPIDGEWGHWSSWSLCSQTCGLGIVRLRKRQCNSPFPRHGGMSCTGIAMQEQACNVLPCPK